MNEKVDAIPLPNEILTVGSDTATVIASVYTTDTEFLLLLLCKTAPYYVVALTDTTRTVTVIDIHHNIVPALQSYEDNGGDY